MAALFKLLRSLFLTAAMFIIFAATFCFAAEEITLTTIMPGLEYAVYEDRKSSGDEGGDSYAGAWNTRVLNTTVASQGSSISRSGNVITLQPGTYRIVASAPAYRIGKHQIRFTNTTDDPNVTVLWGTNEKCDKDTGDDPGHDHDMPVSTRSFIDGIITITAEKNFKLEHFTQRTRADKGLGEDASSGEFGVFARVYIQKLN